MSAVAAEADADRGGVLRGCRDHSVIGVRHTGGVDWIRHALQIGTAIALIIVVAPIWSARAGRKS